jgi:hypothetical protein
VIIQDEMPARVLAVGRLAVGTAGETRRSAHLFDVGEDSANQTTIFARCGAELPLADVEWLRPGSGMPCERCLGFSTVDAGFRPRRNVGV